MLIGFLICIAAGYFLQPYTFRLAKSVAGIRFRSTPTHLVIEPVHRTVACVDCHAILADTLRTFSEFDHQPLCYRCIQQQRRYRGDCAVYLRMKPMRAEYKQPGDDNVVDAEVERLTHFRP